MLTLEQLKQMPPHTVFARGVVVDSLEGINMAGSGKMLKWIAQRGGREDWCIYCYWDSEDWGFVESSGDKVTMEANIKKLVPCNDEAFQEYRY